MKRSDFNFNQPYIKECFFKLNNEFKATDDNINLSTNIETYNSFEPNEKNDSAMCGLIVEIGEESPQSPFFVKINIEAIFSWDDSKSESEITDFFKVNAPSLLVGYARPIITYLTANSPYPPFNLSFINFTE